MYDSASRKTKFIPVLFSEEDAENIPSIQRGPTHYRIDREDGYKDLYRWVREHPRIKKPPLGKNRVLDPVNVDLAVETGDVVSPT